MRPAFWVLVALTVLQIVAGLVALYLWGFGYEMPGKDMSLPLTIGPMITGLPCMFLYDYDNRL